MHTFCWLHAHSSVRYYGLDQSPLSGLCRHQGPRKRESFSASCSTSSLSSLLERPSGVYSIRAARSVVYIAT